MTIADIKPPLSSEELQELGMASRDQPDRIPFADPGSDLAPFREDILAATGQVLDGRQYILGPLVETFEREFAARLGVGGVVGVASGTDALALTLQALGVGQGDEVITVSHTAGAMVAAIRITGASPVLIDIEPATYCMDPAKLALAYGPRTKAIVPVHLYGHPADMAPIMEFGRRRNIPVVEDCAQAQEATIDSRLVGSIGAASSFSFFPTKILGAIGDAGAAATSIAAVEERLRLLRTYGWEKPQFATISGGRSSRLDPLQAAILSLGLRRLGDQVERRRAIAAEYGSAFAGLPLQLPVEKPGCRHVYHLYVVRSDRRDQLRAHLDRDGIGTGIHYPYPVHVQPGLAQGARIPEPLTETETIAREIVTLPLFPSLSQDQQARVIASVRAFFGRR
jgi:dTDP-4-amino-4,6-dideoxygalactose transaminase